MINAIFFGRHCPMHTTDKCKTRANRIQRHIALIPLISNI
jgi:hypothetical protein